MYKNSIEYAQKKQKLVEEKASLLGHQIIWSEYTEVLNNPLVGLIRSERVAQIKITCLLHSNTSAETIYTTYHNYLRAKSGLPCCGQANVSQKLKNRVFSEETKQKMSEAMTRIQATKPRALDDRDSLKYDKWRKDSQKLGNYRCQITGVRPKNLVVHHLFSLQSFKSLMYNSLNSATLDSALHDIFHKIYGYKKPVTIDCFITFLEDLKDNSSFRERVYSFANPRSSLVLLLAQSTSKSQTLIRKKKSKSATKHPSNRMQVQRLEYTILNGLWNFTSAW